MKRPEFLQLCDLYNLDPLIALENSDLVKALYLRNDDKIKKILKEEF